MILYCWKCITAVCLWIVSQQSHVLMTQMLAQLPVQNLSNHPIANVLSQQKERKFLQRQQGIICRATSKEKWSAFHADEWQFTRTILLIIKICCRS